jgi:hypothetical protein
MASSKVKVLCITGWCRNGSTIIGNILNEVSGVFHVGELHFLWKNAAGKGANNLCGCGQPLTQCALWSKILKDGMPAGTPFETHVDNVRRRQLACVRTRHTWRVLKHGVNSEALSDHASLMTQTYHAIAEATDSKIIVDTTKIPGEAALLPRMDGIEPCFVHLVRDPRAVAHSWRKPKQYVYAMSAWKSTAYWVGFNLASHAITRRYPERSMFLRYEDFMARPAETIGALLGMCGLDPALNPVRERKVDLHTNHTVTGNPDRFRTGVTVLRDRDDAWKSELSVSAKASTLALSWPLLRRYGYVTSLHGGGFRPAPGMMAQTSNE